MRKFGLIGYPLSHSFSPAYFAEKFAREGIKDCSYEAFAIETIDKFPALITDGELEGLNVTIPYKKAVIPFLDDASEAVEKTGACNCIKIKNGTLRGFNTDVIGFEKSLAEKLNSLHTEALIIGTGGSAAAVEYVLQKLQIEYLFVSRSISGRSPQPITYNDLSPDVIRQHRLIINTTPVGMYPAVDHAPDIPYEALTAQHYLFDLIYNPAETLFLKKGAEKGAVTKNGADMLIIQAEESWRIWNEV
jgi:shikimate dehydrogenase